MAYDYYSVARELAAKLKEEGHPEWEEKIVRVIEEGFSSTEILMGLKFALSEKKLFKLRLSSDASKLHKELLSKLKSSLTP